MSRGGAARKRAGTAAPDTGSTRVTAPSPRRDTQRRTNWVVVVMITLVMLGLVGGYFVAFAGGGSSATTTTTSVPGT